MKPFVAAAIILLMGPLSASASQSFPDGPAFDVDVRDYATVPRLQMDRALAELRRVFRAAGIDARAQASRRTTGSGESLSAPELTPARRTVVVIVYPHVADDLMTVDPNTLGVVPGAQTGGQLALVFAARIENVAKRNKADAGTLLGIVMAHEVGHVLLPGWPHAIAGVMRPTCDRQQIRRVMMGAVAFGTVEAATIKAVLGAPPLP